MQNELRQCPVCNKDFSEKNNPPRSVKGHIRKQVEKNILLDKIVTFPASFPPF